MQIALRHSGTGNFRFVDTGWSWPIFLGAGFLGLPLFFRGLAMWGVVMVVLWSVQLAVFAGAVEAGDSLGLLLNLAIGGLCIYLGARGNALSARRLLALGYEIARPDSSEGRLAQESWGI